jgi:lipase
VRLHVYEWGELRPRRVVCLHGVTGHGRRFRKLAEERLGAYRVLAPDLRGHGRSGWDEPWTVSQHVGDLVETFTEPAAWIGHSFGGRLVMEVTARRPDLVERAVLIDPAMRIPPDIARQLADYEAKPKEFASLEEVLAERSAGLVHTPREILDEELREHVVQGENGRLTYRYSAPCAAAVHLELASPPPPYEHLRVPTLLLVGADSKLVSAAEATLYGEALGDLFGFGIVPGGHSCLWDAFPQTADAVERFLVPPA